MRALIFDLDNTLFDHAAALHRFAVAAFELTNESAARVVEASRQRSHAEFIEAFADEAGQTTEDVWEQMQSGLALHVEPDLELTTLFESLQATQPELVFGMLTNGGGRMQRSKIEALGLGRFVPADRIVISAEVDLWKPAPEAFRLVCQRCGVEPEEAVYVGDRPGDDVGGARGAGLRTCWVARGKAFPDTPLPDFTIDTVAELPALWERI